MERLQERYDRLKEKCQPFLQALEHFPKLVEAFVEKVKELFSIKEAQERKEREDRAAARKEQSNTVGAGMTGNDNPFHYYPDFLTSSTLELRRYENERHYKHDHQAPRRPRIERQGATPRKPTSFRGTEMPPSWTFESGIRTTNAAARVSHSRRTRAEIFTQHSRQSMKRNNPFFGW